MLEGFAGRSGSCTCKLTGTMSRAEAALSGFRADGDLETRASSRGQPGRSLSPLAPAGSDPEQDAGSGQGLAQHRGDRGRKTAGWAWGKGPSQWCLSRPDAGCQLPASAFGSTPDPAGTGKLVWVEALPAAPEARKEESQLCGRQDEGVAHCQAASAFPWCNPGASY